MRLDLHGVSRHEALFYAASGQGVIVNTRSMTASVLPFEEAEVSEFWTAPERDAPVETWAEVAEHAFSARQPSDVTVVAAGLENRAYTVPKAVATTARTALRTASGRRPGVTAVGRRVATLLSSGQQVSKSDLLYVNKFFTRNTEETAGSARWQLWGGNHGRNWSQQVVSKFPVTAAASTDVRLIEFYDGDDHERTFWCERDREHALSLYRQDEAGNWLAWGDGDWFAASEPNSGQLVQLDDDTAVYVAGALYDAPDTPVSLRDFNPEEWDIVQEGLPGLDWETVERVMTAAAPPNTPRAKRDGDYTPEERSKNAASQLRDANGRFASVGDGGVIKSSGTRGKIINTIPAEGAVIIQADDGNTYQIPSGEFEVDPGGPQPVSAPQPAPKIKPLNLKGILGQPRATTTTPKAWLDKLLPPMGAGQLKQVIKDYEGFIDEERRKNARKFKGGTPQFALGDEVEGTPPPSLNGDKKTPDTSDVAPLRLAIVDRDDPQAVTDLVSLVPASSAGSAATAYRRVAGEWVEDVKILQDMRSPTPPPVVKLDEALYASVLQQVDSNLPDDPDAPATEPEENEAPVQASGDFTLSVNMDPACIFGWDEDGNLCAIVSAGGLDRNRGNAEKLRRYWLYGKGAAKIRWGTDGDWYRCVRQLSKYLGPRAKGYCALRHKEATGMWTGDRRNRDDYSLTAGGSRYFSTDDIRTTKGVIRNSAEHARALAAKQRVYALGDAIGPVVSEPEEITAGRAGRAFKIPLVIPEGLESGDGRTFDRGALSMRSFPIPLLWQIKTGDGHDGAFVVGRIDHVERTEDGLGNAYGVFDTGPYGAEAQRMVESKMLRFVSADLDRFEAEEVELAEEDAPNKLRIKKGRLMGVTLVAKPAFQECTIELVPLEEVVPVNDGTYVGEPTGEEAENIVASAGIASAIPVEPPDVWFERPVLNGPTPITVTDSGQLFGHIATWDTSHIGLPGATRAPRSASNYAYFHTGVVRTSDGKDVNVGQLTLAGGHADLTADAAAAVKHYDDTGSAIADVHAGEDSYGIWVAGALRPGTSPEQVRALRASAPSGDWRLINGRLELVAVCQVNVPGFPVTRAQIVASGGVSALVAAGASVLAKMKQSPMDELSSRIAAIEAHEQKRAAARKAEVLSRMAPILSEKAQAKTELNSLAASARERVYKVLDVDGYLSEFKDFSPERREALAKEKKALKDGSFPIENVADLRRAVRAYGRASDDKKAQVRRHIIRRARSLGKTELIPDDWSENSMNDLALIREDTREVMTAAALSNRRDAISKRLRGEG
jgi:hypothetical protein